MFVFFQAEDGIRDADVTGVQTCALPICRRASALAGAADAEARRQAARALGERGAMEDIPRLARALRDADPLVRTFAESALWQGWRRPGGAEGDPLLGLGGEQMEARGGGGAGQALPRGGPRGAPV